MTHYLCQKNVGYTRLSDTARESMPQIVNPEILKSASIQRVCPSHANISQMRFWMSGFREYVIGEIGSQDSAPSYSSNAALQRLKNPFLPVHFQVTSRI